MWMDEAIRALGAVHDRAPLGARAIVLAVDTLAGSPFPAMYRRVEERPEEHVLSAPPYAVFYRVDGDTLTVVGVADVRRRQDPW